MTFRKNAFRASALSFAFAAALCLAASPAAAQTTLTLPFAQDFTSGTAGVFGVSQAPAPGGGTGAKYNGSDDVFTRFAGYSNTFPAGGFVTALDIWLNPAIPTGQDLRNDYTVAISQDETCAPNAHRRDFIFNFGTTPSVPGSWTVSGSNNTPGWPSNPDRNPVNVPGGWYTFQHTFADNAGVLQVKLELIDRATSNVLGTWVLSDPTDTIDGGTCPGDVGGNRYGWVIYAADMPSLVYDNWVLEVSLNAVKQDVLADLQGLLPTLTKPNSDKVKSAIDHLQKSLNPKFWIDGTHLSKDGKTVFDEEKKAVHSLEEVVPRSLVQSSINALVADDRSLATTAIAASTKPAGDISKANAEIAKGDTDNANGKYEEAIGHYKNAWDLAT